MGCLVGQKDLEGQMDQKDPQDHGPLADLRVAWVVVEARTLAGLKSLRDQEVHLLEDLAGGEGLDIPLIRDPLPFYATHLRK